MRDHQKIAGFKKQIGQLNAQLQEEIEEASRRTGHSKAEIDLALEDRGWLRPAPMPEGYPESLPLEFVVVGDWASASGNTFAYDSRNCSP